MKIFTPLILTTTLLLFVHSGMGQNTSLRDFNWQADSSGLKYLIHKSGNSNRPVINSEVKISYLTILDGNSKPDTSLCGKYSKVEILSLSEMMNGFVQSVCMLGEGGEGFFCVPPSLAYGNLKENKFQNDTFYFYINLISVIDTKKQDDISTQLTLSYTQFNNLFFDITNISETRNILGKPTLEKKSWSIANLGFMCVHSFISIFNYDKIGAEITFYSLEKDKKDKKVLSRITFNSDSKVKINNSLVLNSSDTLAVKKIFGNVGSGFALDNDKKELNWYYKLKFVGQDVNARFVFNDKGILQRLEITKDK